MRRGRLAAVAMAATLGLGTAVMFIGQADDQPSGAPGSRPESQVGVQPPGAPSSPSSPEAAALPAPSTAAQIEGRVTVAAGSGPIPAGMTVVVYAYPVAGPPGASAPNEPLAVQRFPAAALPLHFRLDDRMAPRPGHHLSGAPRLVIGARLGPGAEALAQVGDWLAPSQTLAPGAQGVELVLQAPPR